MQKNNTLAIGDVVYVYKDKWDLYSIVDFTEINGTKYCWLKKDPDDRFSKRYHPRFVHIAPNDDTKEHYLKSISPEHKLKMKELYEEAAKWLADRQDELKDLSFRRYDGDLWREQKKLLREAGYFVYDLRDWGEGNGFNIEHKVWVDHIGCWVTDMDLTPYMNEGKWIGIDELSKANIVELPYDELKSYLKKGHDEHFAAKKVC